MIITERTLVRECAQITEYMTDKSRTDLEEKAVERFGCFDSLTIEQMAEVVASNLTPIIGEGWNSDPTLFQWAWIKYIKREMETFAKNLERLSISETAEEKQASEGLPSVSFIEGLLVFAQSFFSLHSFSEASQICMGDILIAKKAEYRRGMMQRRLDKIQIDKMKSKK